MSDTAENNLGYLSSWLVPLPGPTARIVREFDVSRDESNLVGLQIRFFDVIFNKIATWAIAEYPAAMTTRKDETTGKTFLNVDSPLPQFLLGSGYFPPIYYCVVGVLNNGYSIIETGQIVRPS